MEQYGININKFGELLVLDIEDILGLEFKNKERLYTLLLNDRDLKNDKENNNRIHNNCVRRLGASLLNLIKIEYIFRNITTDFETLRLIDTRTKKTIRNDLSLSLDIIESIKKYNQEDIFNTDSYDILKTVLGIIYIENNYTVVKEIIVKDVKEIIEKFISKPQYNWYTIIKAWALDNNVKLQFDLINRETFDNYQAFGVSLKGLSKEAIGYGDTLNEARIATAYKYFQQYLSNEEVDKYVPKMSFKRYEIADNKLSISRRNELAEIKDIRIEDDWILNQCFVHNSYIQDNQDSKYESNESISYLGNSVRYLVVNEFIYKNRILFEKEFNKLFDRKRKEILHPKVNSDLFLERQYIKYMLISNKAKKSVPTGVANNTINALLGTIFIWCSDLNNIFIEVYLEHIINYLPEIKKYGESINKKINNVISLARNNNDLVNLGSENYRNSGVHQYSELFDDSNFLPVVILDGGESVSKQIVYLAERIKIKNIYIASGFVYKSGLVLLEDIINNIHKNNGNIEIIVGSLQKYNKYKSSNKNEIIIGMDKDTAIHINMLIKEKSLKIKTLEQSFYHGKFFMLEGEEQSCFLIGSSNISNSAFNINRELNLLYILDNKDDNYFYFSKWYEDISKECMEINELDEEYFNDTEIDYITNYSMTKVKYDRFIDEIEHLTDEEVKFRLNLWMNKKPNSIYSDLGIESLQEYYLFEYKEYDLIVLESFNFQNSFYCFKDQSTEELLFKLRDLTKTEIFELSSMEKRGYHISDRQKLEFNVNLYFTRRYDLD